MTQTEQIQPSIINSTATPTISQLLAKATKYHNMGLAVVPFILYWDNEKQQYNKDNIGTWAKWETQPQTDEEFNALQWNKNSREANAFGVLLGTKAKNGKFLSVVDHDTKGNTFKPGAVEKGKEILKDFPITKVTKTANGGLHYEYWSTIKPKIEGTFHDEAALELLGEKKLSVMEGLGYQNLNDNPPTEIYSLEGTFYSILKKHGFSLNEETEIENQQDSCSCQISKIIDLTKLENKGNGQYQGCHPIHDSTTEKNFCVDIKKNTWFCFRHNSGGGALQFLAVKEGLIKCEQAKKGALRGQKFREVLKIAVAQGLIDEKILDQSEINPTILAKDIMADHIFVVDKETDELYYYVDCGEDEGTYSNQTEQLIRREITARLDENFKARYKPEVTEFILGTAPLIQMGNTNPKLIAIQNGMLNLITHEIEAYNNKYYITNKLPVTLNKNTDSHVWKDFIEKVVPNKKQRKQLQQLVGHTLYGKILVEICTVLLGGGSNGKTIFLQIITKFLGSAKNVSSHSIQQLCYDKFVTGEVKGKLANICADLPHKELMNTANFKALTSGDSMQAYIKHVQKTASFSPTTKYIFSANQIPPIANEEDCFAWYRRFVFIDFPVTFTKENSKPRQELLDILSTPEVFSEILNWAMEGLDYLLAHGDIEEKPTVDEVRLIYIKKSDSALAYFADKVKCTDNPEDYAFTDQWHRDYVTYCHANGLKPKTQGDFVNTVKNHLPGAEKTRIRPENALKSSSALSAFRYVKISYSVPTVLAVPTSENMRAKNEKNTPDKNPNLEQLFSKASTASTASTNDTLIYGQRIKRQPGVTCQQIEQDEHCIKEAEYRINGNLYCPSHFDAEKENLRQRGKVVCLESS